MDELKIFKSFTVLLKGKKGKETICLCYPDNTHKLTDDKIFIGKVARNNLQVKLGDKVIVQGYPQIALGKKVNISFLEDTIKGITGDLYKRYLVPYFKDSYRPVHTGDIVSWNNVEFKILQTDPGKCCVVTPSTKIDIAEPIKREKKEEEEEGDKEQTNKEEFVNDILKINEELTQKIKILTNELDEEKKKNKMLNEQLNYYKNNDINKKENSLQIELNKKAIEIENLKAQIKNLKSKKLQANLEYINPGEKILAIQFNSIDQKVNKAIACKNTDVFVRIEEILYEDYPEYKDVNTYFTVGGKIIKRFKSIQENDIKYSDIILLNIYE